VARRGNENHHEARHVDSVGGGCRGPAERICRTPRADRSSGGSQLVLRGNEGMAKEGQSLPGLLRDPGLPGSAGGSPGGNTRTIL